MGLSGSYSLELTCDSTTCSGTHLRSTGGIKHRFVGEFEIVNSANQTDAMKKARKGGWKISVDRVLCATCARRRLDAKTLPSTDRASAAGSPRLPRV